MPERANVASIEAIEDFRASLINFVSKARPAVDEVAAEVLRTRLWLQNDRRLHWENQVRQRTKAFEKARQAVFSAGLSELRSVSAAEQMAVTRAKRELEVAEEGLRRVKQWHRDFDRMVEPVAKQLDPLSQILANDMPKAAAWLANVIKSLEAYAELRPTVSLAEPTAGAELPSGEATGDPAKAPAPSESSDGSGKETSPS